jgi:hypothetical protein
LERGCTWGLAQTPESRKARLDAEAKREENCMIETGTGKRTRNTKRCNGRTRKKAEEEMRWIFWMMISN